MNKGWRSCVCRCISSSSKVKDNFMLHSTTINTFVSTQRNWVRREIKSISVKSGYTYCSRWLLFFTLCDLSDFNIFSGKRGMCQARINKCLCGIQIKATESHWCFLGRWGRSNKHPSQIRFSPTLITVVLLLIPPCSQSGNRQTYGRQKIDSVYCIAGGKWRTSLPADSLHLPSLPLISTPQQLASHLVTGKWYSAGSVWEEMAGCEAQSSRGRATDKSC